MSEVSISLPKELAIILMAKLTEAVTTTYSPRQLPRQSEIISAVRDYMLKINTGETVTHRELLMSLAASGVNPTSQEISEELARLLRKKALKKGNGRSHYVKV